MSSQQACVKRAHLVEPSSVNTLLTIAATLTMSTSAGAAKAQSSSGNWPLTVSHSQRSNGTYCLTLTDDGSLGWPHSGLASLVGGGGKLPYGTFQLIDHILVVTIQQQGGSQNAGLVFVAPVVNGNIGKGTYDQVYGGEEFDSGVLMVGVKGGC